MFKLQILISIIISFLIFRSERDGVFDFDFHESGTKIIECGRQVFTCILPNDDKN